MALTKLAEVVRRYNAAQNDVPRKVRQHWPGFDSHTPGSQAEKIQQERGFVRDDFLPEIDKLILSLADERKESERALTKAMYPAMSASDATTRQVGEMQLASARSFLAGDPDAAAIGREARLSLSLGRIDAAWTLIAAMRAAIPAGGPVNDEGRAMERELQETLAAADESKTVAALEKELAGFPEEAAMSARQQMASGRERVVVPEVFSLLTPEEQRQAMLFVESTGSTLEKVQLKQRAYELHLYEPGR